MHIEQLWWDAWKRKQDALLLFFSLFFIHFEGMQVQCTTKTRHQAMGSSRAEEMKLLWRRRRRRRRKRRVLCGEETAKFKEQPEVVQSDSGTRQVSHTAECLRSITFWLLLPWAAPFWSEEGEFDLKHWPKADLGISAPYGKTVGRI